jgi:hypothetical protein
MWSKELPTGSWIDCLDAIENELDTLKRIRSDVGDSHAFQEKLTNHEMRTSFDLIWRYAGKAVKDLE